MGRAKNTPLSILPSPAPSPPILITFSQAQPTTATINHSLLPPPTTTTTATRLAVTTTTTTAIGTTTATKE